MAVAAPARPGTKAQVRYVRMSATKARAVLDLIRGKSVAEADEVLILSQRDPARVIQKCLRSAVANAEHNDGLDPEELFVSACFADEGPTLRRFRPRARGRATRIRKRTCHITVAVSRYDDDELQTRRERERSKGAKGGRARDTASRRRRVAKSRGEAVEEPEVTEEVEEEITTDEVEAPAEAEVTDDSSTEPEAAERSEAAESADTDAEGGGPEGDRNVEELVSAHTKEELLEIAETSGLEVAKSWTKPQIAEAIVQAQEED
jgi:large subunit ribosomal protein L22